MIKEGLASSYLGVANKALFLTELAYSHFSSSRITGSHTTENNSIIAFKRTIIFINILYFVNLNIKFMLVLVIVLVRSKNFKISFSP